MVRRLIKSGHQCVVFDRSSDAVKALVKEGSIGVVSLADFVNKLSKPRAVWLMVPAGVVDASISDLLPLLEPSPGDAGVIADEPATSLQPNRYRAGSGAGPRR